MDQVQAQLRIDSVSHPSLVSEKVKKIPLPTLNQSASPSLIKNQENEAYHMVLFYSVSPIECEGWRQHS